MVIGACTVELHLPSCRNLKDKRSVIKRLTRRISGRFNVAVAEVGFQDLWQRSCIAVVSVSTSRNVLESTFRKVVDELEHGAEALVTDIQTEFL